MIATLTRYSTASASQGLSLIESPPGTVYAVQRGLCPVYFSCCVSILKGKGGRTVIKGVNRQVIVVKSPDRRFFEEAIFIVREGVAGSRGVTADQIVAEARQVADSYARHRGTHWYERVPRLAWAAAGALLSTAAWAVAML